MEGERGQIVPHAPTREFQLRIVDQRVERCFLARFPPEDRSERDTLVGVLVDQDRGRWKKLPEVRCSDDCCGLCEAFGTTALY